MKPGDGILVKQIVRRRQRVFTVFGSELFRNALNIEDPAHGRCDVIPDLFERTNLAGRIDPPDRQIVHCIFHPVLDHLKDIDLVIQRLPKIPFVLVGLIVRGGALFVEKLFLDLIDDVKQAAQPEVNVVPLESVRAVGLPFIKRFIK